MYDLLINLDSSTVVTGNSVTNLTLDIADSPTDLVLDLNSYPVYGASSTFTFTQSVAATSWTVNHNLNKYPSVTVLNAGGQELICQVSYMSLNQVIVAFNIALTGKVICV